MLLAPFCYPFFLLCVVEKEMINNSGQGKYKNHRVRILTSGGTVYTDCETKEGSRAKHFALAGEAV